MVNKVYSQKKLSLKPYNTFNIDVQANDFIKIQTEEELINALQQFPNPFILGGGSNMLLTQNIEKPVFHIQLKGISIEKETEDFVWIKAQAGENWHKFVLHTLNQGFGGLENLSLIPGNVGTTPIQNIGAYGIEIKDVMENCEAIHVKTYKKKTFSNADCKFAYRESIFKNEEKDNYIITSVTFKLTKRNHVLHTEYGAIKDVLSQREIKNPTPKDISEAVIFIRESKLPDPKKIGNSGSFFKNPIVTKMKFKKLQEKYPKMPFYELNQEEVKIPAGWLIDTCKLKGYRKGDAGVHEKQALVLVNYGNATGSEIFEIAHFVKNKVKENFDIELEFEVNIF
ncbi:UDP-N-acetylmuramate dehydrogenase [Capnocytophaga cynodegmi]|uniref:UDP-N-acetylmuramate dehydrogenase n=1 Tax=Capnocytophaga cynodegmi TaxID=28189 RepID=UPI00385B0B88